MGGGQVQQGNAAAAAAALYDHHPGAVTDAGDAVMARWLQSAGLQHLASPLASADQRLLPNLLMQGYGPQSAEEKQRLMKLLRNLNFGESASEPYTPMAHSFGAAAATDGFYSPELRGEFGAGLLDLHSMDDTELLSEHVISEEPFEPSPFIPLQEFDNNLDAIHGKPQDLSDFPGKTSYNDKETGTRESNVAKIKVVVRKRPINKKEISRKEEDIVTVHENAYLTVHEPKLKVDLTAYVEKHEFCFDAVLDEHVSNDEVYRVTVEPIIPTIFEHTKATCFAYGQTGSGKTYTMKPLPLRAVGDIVRMLHQPQFRNQRLKLWLSYFEIYGGKLFDLLSDRRKLCMREDGRQQVCIVGLQEFEVSDVQIVNEFIEKGNAARSTGSTGANEESSRSHAILQLAVKKHKEVTDTRRQNDATEAKSGKVIGKISFIDLAGSERGADTTDNDRQTRIEGAEINKSLLALKECIRALDNDQIHIPFRGSKLTEVLRDSFVGNSRTVMISCISPNAGSCEHTLNTLRYADRVKSLSKSGNSRKDQPPGQSVLLGKESSSASAFPFIDETEEFVERNNDFKPLEIPQRSLDAFAYSSTYTMNRNSATTAPSYSYNEREEGWTSIISSEREKIEAKNSYGGPSNKSFSSVQNTFDGQDEPKASKVSPTHRKAPSEEKSEKRTGWSRRDIPSDGPATSYKQQIEQEAPLGDGEINALLEEEEALIAAHRKEIENTMEIVREEMNILADVDRPGSQIDSYVSQLSFLLSRKAAGLVSLQARLARFQHRLKEHEILTRKKGPK
ncbi:Diatom spindle kinesin 1 [Apostasia shenzhenica]|uniref:Kinesin-like protein n=1 Tax=Apostasia shenzhenica TaxID=1088818 RepID=A0A2I0B590_9ASPA|nr:Diatom spindle kinesin 1 [Apostasia shenzhenica]